MPYADVTGARLWYEDTGGDSPALVLVHALLLDQEMWTDQVAAVRDGYRVITLDCRAHGKTSYDGQPFDIWDLARDLLALADQLELGPLVLAGASLGAEVCLRAALLAPERVRALALCGALAGVESPTVRAGYEQLATTLRDSGMLAELATSLIDLLVDGPEARRHWAGKLAATPGEAIFHAASCVFGRDDLANRLATVSCPTLLLHGQADPLVATVRAQALAELLPGCAELITVDGAGHVVPLTHAEAVAAAMRKFLDGLPEPSA